MEKINEIKIWLFETNKLTKLYLGGLRIKEIRLQLLKTDMKVGILLLIL